MGKSKDFDLKKWFKKHWSNLLFAIFLILMLIPATRTPIQVTVNRVFSFSPSIISEDKQETLNAFEWQLIDLEGNEINLSNSKNKVILINVWATWCPPCIAEMPSLQGLYTDYKDQVDFYFVANDNPEAVNKFVAKHKYNFPVFMEASNAPNQLQSNSLPTTFLIDKKGNIVVSKTGAANWNSDQFRAKLDELLGQ